jgi:phosphatidylglycerophosphate synthase
VLRRESVPNLVSGLRLASVPVLWGFAVAGYPGVVGAGVLFAWLTDALDGFLARVLDARSALGSRLDSLADTAIFVSALGWVAMLRPEFVREHWVVLATWLAIGTTGYVVGWIRFRRIADIHLYSAKVANFAGLMFAAALLAFGTYPPFVFTLVIIVCMIAAVETLIVFAAFEQVSERVKSAFWARAGGR